MNLLTTTSMKNKKSNIGKNRDLPATQGMLFEVRDEMMSRFLGAEHELKFVRKDMESLKQEVKAEFQKAHHKMDAFEKRMEAAYHKTALLVEEQNVNNKIVLDLIRMFADDHEELKSRISELEKKCYCN